MDMAGRTLPNERFCTSPCPVCEGPALELYVTLQKLHVECGCCGSFDVTVAERSAMAKSTRQARMAWLARLRGQSPGEA